ncbi:MAG: amino acid permease C-terminal domain-containing protein [Terracidiphilus sp.]
MQLFVPGGSYLKAVLDTLLLIAVVLRLSRVIPLIPIFSVIFCFLLMAGLPIITWFRFFIWLDIGLAIYFLYSYLRSEFAKPLVPLAIPWYLTPLLTFATFGLFLVILFFVQARFVARLDRNHRPTVWGILALVSGIGTFYTFSALTYAAGAGQALYLPDITPGFIFGVIELSASVFFLRGAVFEMRRSLLKHYNQVEPIDLRISALMTFFFGILYLQYHLTRIAKWKESGPPASQQLNPSIG